MFQYSLNDFALTTTAKRFKTIWIHVYLSYRFTTKYAMTIALTMSKMQNALTIPLNTAFQQFFSSLASFDTEKGNTELL